jgi:hypothetical protein
MLAVRQIYQRRARMSKAKPNCAFAVHKQGWLVVVAAAPEVGVPDLEKVRG